MTTCLDNQMFYFEEKIQLTKAVEKFQSTSGAFQSSAKVQLSEVAAILARYHKTPLFMNISNKAVKPNFSAKLEF